MQDVQLAARPFDGRENQPLLMIDGRCPRSLPWSVVLALLWQIGAWRCELHESSTLRLWREHQLVAEETHCSAAGAGERSAIWRAAVQDVEDSPTAGISARL